MRTMLASESKDLRFGFLSADEAGSGGMFQYSSALLESLKWLASERRISAPTILTRRPGRSSNEPLSIESSGAGLFRLLVRRLLPPPVRAWARRRPRLDHLLEVPEPGLRKGIQNRIASLGVDVLLLPAPDALAFEAGVPSIMAIHDLQHRLQPEFPEVSQKGEWAAREYIYRNAVRESLLLLVDSEVGKEDVLDLYGKYGATADKLMVFPFVASPTLHIDVTTEQVEEVLRRFALPDRFLLYPAQFWPHKNHLRLVEALSHMQQEDAHLVLCGTHSGALRRATFREVMQRARELKLDHRIHYLGYVSDEDLSALYASAVGLVFPTFFGPTNIPVIEAWNFRIPVLTSRIRGITEQVGDAGLLVDPRSVEEMAAGMERIWTDSALRMSLVEAGTRQLALYTPEDHRERLAEILAEAAARLRA